MSSTTTRTTGSSRGSGSRPAPTPRRARRGALAGLGALLLVVALLSLALGARDVPVTVVVESLAGQRAADDYDALVVLGERVPRTVLGLLVGALLGASGAVMQALTRNPLADPGVLGIELGASCAVVLGIMVGGATSTSTYFWYALVGAALTAAAVHAVSRLASATSSAVALVIAGATASALLGAVITLLTVRDEALYLSFRSWSVGQLAGRTDVMGELWPFALVGTVLVLTRGGFLNALALGEEAAAALGVRVHREQVAAAAVAVLLCAAATAAVGPVAFVGLIGAHLARSLVGPDHRRLLPCSMLCGAVVLLAADVLGRLAPGSGEVEVGVMTALVGTPFFVLLARRDRAVAP